MFCRRISKIAAIAFGVAGSIIALAPSAVANSFGGYTFTVSTSVLGERVSIRDEGSGAIHSNNFVLYRAVLQVDGGGLMQAGIIQTGSGLALDSCGTTTSMRNYEETHAASSSQPYRCYYISNHPQYTQHLYAVAKTAAQGVGCMGCYTSFIDGKAVGPGQVSLAYGSNSAASAPNGSASGETVQTSSNENFHVEYGNVSGVGGTDLQWTNDLYSGASWYYVSPSSTYCQDTDGHFQIGSYGVTWGIRYSIPTGSC